MMSLTGDERTKRNEQSSGPKADKGKVFLPPTLSETLFQRPPQRLLLPLTGLVDRGPRWDRRIAELGALVLGGTPQKW